MPGMEKCLFELKMSAKSLERASKKCDKEEKMQKTKLRSAIQKNNMEGAKIHAENAIRQKNQSLNFLRMSARIDGVSSRVQTAIQMKNVTKNMASVTKNMESAMRSMDLEKISLLMDRFEKQFENLDIQSEYMENAMSGTTQQFAPQDEVQMLMQKTAEEAGLDMNLTVPTASNQSIAASNASAEQDELSQRLARLREV
ncbi:charged multivesicular body protein 1b-like [Ciona intestinalis]